MFRILSSVVVDTDRSIYVEMPLLTQSDAGTENFGVANVHTILRHRQDPALSASLQHKFMVNNKNIKPEVFWGMFRRNWTPGYEDVFEYGLVHGLYDPDNMMERYVCYRFQFLEPT